MMFAAGLVLGYGIGCLTITPICTTIVRLIAGDEWRDVMHNELV